MLSVEKLKDNTYQVVYQHNDEPRISFTMTDMDMHILAEMLRRWGF